VRIGVRRRLGDHGAMEARFHEIAGIVATAIEAVMLLIIVIGAVQALIEVFGQLARREGVRSAIRVTWLRFAAWIVLALEFALAADIIRTIVSPSWDEIGQLAAIGTIRTALSLFLGRDIEEFRIKTERAAAAETDA
jgi:uncharacterized membrane protein